MTVTWKISGLAAVLLVLPTMAVDGAFAQMNGAKVFDTPQQAVTALIDAARNKDQNGILAVLGPETEEWLSSGDEVQDAQGRERFVAAYDQKNSVEMPDDETAILHVGDDEFPFPFPVVKLQDGWSFDAEEGREELLDRRIGENELNAIEVVQAVADAQVEYSTIDWDEDGLLEYAPQFASTEGDRDGLYWPLGEDGIESPLGPLVAEASAEGYTGGGSDEDATAPYHGYQYRIIMRQGADAPGGAYEYSVDGDMIGGFAVLAYPARYNASGIMTFIVSHQGTVYETDLGEDTEAAALAIEAFNPDAKWTEVKPD
jgi:hypothetical protein